MQHSTTLRILGIVCLTVIALVLGYLDLLGLVKLASSVTELLLFFLGVFATFAFQLVIWPERVKTTETQDKIPAPASIALQRDTITKDTELAKNVRESFLTYRPHIARILGIPVTSKDASYRTPQECVSTARAWIQAQLKTHVLSDWSDRFNRSDDYVEVLGLVTDDRQLQHGYMVIVARKDGQVLDSLGHVRNLQ